ncbi:MAG: HAD-IC family P-type ATPase, partial [Candidatus Nomurabacteria bacterium]|nr:HAD-IC family P-type ATPase [Candidatus Nomurabacteria bacterium]
MYDKTVEEIAKALGANVEKGLTREKVRQNQEKFGKNALKIKSKSLFKKIVEPFLDVFTVMLIVAGVLGFVQGNTLDVILVAVIIAVDAGISYVQQFSTDRILGALRNTIPQKVAVLREGKKIQIDATDLVVGDVIYLYEGEKIPTDCRLLAESGLTINESILTGETEAVRKKVGALHGDKKIYEQSNMLFSGTFVASGSATGLVVAVGNNTEYGRIAKLVAGSATISPIQQKTAKFVSKIAIAVVIVAVLALILAIWRGIETVEALRFALALTVSAVPEGLPITISIILAFGMKRMAKKRALVTNMRAIETIGAVNVIATDKTGTLTENRLSVQGFWRIGDKKYQGLSVKKHLATTGVKDFYAATLMAAAPSDLASDPLDVAMLNFAEKISVLPKYELVKNYPFEQSLAASGNLWEATDDSLTLFVKGAPEGILAHCNLKHTDYDQCLMKIGEFGSQGFRVIAIASEKIAKVKQNSERFTFSNRLTFIG